MRGIERSEMAPWSSAHFRDMLQGCRPPSHTPHDQSHLAPPNPPCIRNLSDAGVRSDAAMDPAAAGSIARLTAPVTPQATTVDEHRDRRRCHARPDSRWIAHRTYKEGYRG